MYCYHFPTLASFSCFETSFKTNFLFFNGPFPFELRGCFCSWCYLLCFCGEPFYHGPPFLWDVLLGSFPKRQGTYYFLKILQVFLEIVVLKSFVPVFEFASFVFLLQLLLHRYRPIYNDDDDHIHSSFVCKCSGGVIPVICGIFYLWTYRV